MLSILPSFRRFRPVRLGSSILPDAGTSIELADKYPVVFGFGGGDASHAPRPHPRLGGRLPFAPFGGCRPALVPGA
jgi:hypothetical protein